jgi:hypothetical protein
MPEDEARNGILRRRQASAIRGVVNLGKLVFDISISMFTLVALFGWW